MYYINYISIIKISKCINIQYLQIFREYFCKYYKSIHIYRYKHMNTGVIIYNCNFTNFTSNRFLLLTTGFSTF